MDDDNSEPVAGYYNDANRAFLQAFIARGTMTFKDSKPILAAIFTAEGTPTEPRNVTGEDFDSFRDAAAEALSPFDIEIRSAAHQVSKTRVYAIVNSTSDPLTQGATIRSPEEIAYIKRIIDAMFDTYNTPKREIMGVTGMQALKTDVRKGASRQSIGDEVANTQVVDKGVTSQQAEKLLNDMVVEGWFERSREGWYTLSPRALMELKNWLVETYNDAEEPEEWQPIKFCMACREIVTVGQRCSNEECNARLHNICQESYWKSRPVGEKTCPKCDEEWTGTNWVGEKAETSRESYQKGRRKSGTNRREDVVEEGNEGGDDDDEEEDAEGEDE